MKDLGITKLYLDLQIEHLHNNIFVHQSNYIQKILKRFNMDKFHPLGTPMIFDHLMILKMILIVPKKIMKKFLVHKYHT
jgi:hypothetical protein